VAAQPLLQKITEPAGIPVGRAAVAAGPFGDVLVVVDLPKGRYLADDAGRVTGAAG
jgi:hypothetical protein